jgi:hypothetical protein
MTTVEIIPVALRRAVPTDMGLVYDSWLKSFRDQNAEMRSSDYYEFQRKRIDTILAAGAQILVAHPDGTPNVIAAWVCLDRIVSIFHYVYTVAHYRHRGYAGKLVGSRMICTHMTDSRRPDSFAAWKRRAGFRYVPHLLDAA